jgi:hypothetical protein
VTGILYRVIGSGEFPTDMLRHDDAHIATGLQDAMHLRGRRSVLIEGYRRPTVARWESFGWTVEPVQVVDKDIPETALMEVW